MAVFDEKWQKTMASITERGTFLFNNELLSDVSLVVKASSDEGKLKKSKMAIPAHKFVLTICSPVFFAMFCGELAERSDSVDLPDCEYEGVLEMLRYMYSEDVTLNENNVLQVLYVAKKYMVNSLVGECIEFLQENLNPENVFCVLSHAQQYDEKVLVDQCWEMIDSETEEALKSEGFATIERSLLEAVVKRDSLTIREVELFKAVDLWATKECERQGLTTDGSMKRKILGENIFKEIRFPAMEEKEFASTVLACQILTPEELIDIVKCFNSVVTLPVCFSQNERTGTVQSCHRFGDIMGYSPMERRWDYNHNSGEKECIDFQVDKDINLHGIRMFGSEKNDYVVILKIRDTHLVDNVVAHKSGTFSSGRVKFQSTYQYGFDVVFDSPIFLNKNIKYCVEAVIDGPDSGYGIEGTQEAQCHGVKFLFWDCERRNRGVTDVDLGQFAAFLFRPK